MKREKIIPHKYESLSDLHQMLGLPEPLHPMISLLQIEDENELNNRVEIDQLPSPHILNFYKISYKSHLQGRLKYGQHYYDFDEGGLLFASPNQLLANENNNDDHSGYTLLIHPDFLLTYPLAKTIKHYGFFSYSTSEALYLADHEKKTIILIFKIIKEELNGKIDDFSQDVMIAQIELLLSYSNRFYKRQFITQKAVNNSLLQGLEEFLDDYFNNKEPLIRGLPTVQLLSEHLNTSPSYLSDMLCSLTGQNARQHIHNKLINMAKEKLSTTELSINEIAYELGYEHSQSFSTLFKSKTNLTPLQYRRSFS